MKKKFLFGALVSMLLLVSFSGCTRSSGGDYMVSGVLPDSTSDGRSIFLVNQDNWKHVDTAVVQGDRFVFEGTIGTPTFCRLTIKPGISSFLILEKGEIGLDYTKSKYPGGTSSNDELARINQKEDNQMREFTQGMRKAIKEKKGLAAYKEEYAQKIKKQARELFNQHRDDAIGHYLLYSSYMNVLDDEERRKVIQNLGPSLQASSRGQYLQKQLNNQK